MHYGQNHKYEQHQTQADAWKVTSTLAVGPFRDAADERDDENSGQDKEHRCVLLGVTLDRVGCWTVRQRECNTRLWTNMSGRAVEILGSADSFVPIGG